MSSLVNALFAAILADRTQVTVELLVRLSSVCPSVVCHECIVAKRSEIGPRLLLTTNRKSHIGFQMT